MNRFILLNEESFNILKFETTTERHDIHTPKTDGGSLKFWVHWKSSIEAGKSTKITSSSETWFYEEHSTINKKEKKKNMQSSPCTYAAMSALEVVGACH